MAFVNLPPAFQEIFNGIYDRLAKLETGPNQALYVAESAQGSSSQALIEAEAAAAAAGVAQAQATQALAEATTAYNAAIGSLQPSASTIVNASNQMTAIAANGITVYSGASASSGARVVMNSLGLAGYNAGGTATFSILASTGAATFSGNVTGATITGSDLNIAGVFIVNGTTGVMTATSATVTGVINATSGYFGSAANGWSISSTGLTGVGTGNITGGLITGSTFQTAASSTRITINASSDNAIKIYPDSSLQPGYISASSSSGAGSLRINGPYQSGWNNSNIQLYSLGASLSYVLMNADVVSVNAGFTVTNGSIFSGSAQFSSSITYPGVATASGSTLVVVNTGSRIGYVSSSRATKKNIDPIPAGTFIDKLLALEPVAFDWKDQPEDMPYRRNYGLIAEDVAAIGSELESIVNYNAEGAPVSISYDRLTTFLLLAVKELQDEINQMRGQ